MAFLKNLDINGNSWSEDQKEIKNEDLQVENLKSQDLASDNTFTGIGVPWNVTHYANRTKTNLAVSINNNSYDASQQVELYGWNGYQLNSTIKNLYDTRNWINGTFHRGSFGGGSPSGSNDSQYIANWTFKEADIRGYTNPMSGNYYDTSSSVSDGQDCLELSINASSGSYDVGDKCWWETIIEADRGEVDQAWLSFSIRAYSADVYNNHMVLQVVVNNKTIWGMGLASILEVSGNPSIGTWGEWYNPYPIYIDGDDKVIFPDGFKNMNVTLEFKRVSGTASVYGDHSLLFDNVSLIVKAKAKPSHLELKLNNQDVNDTANYGEGFVGMLGNWTEDPSVYANFSSNIDWPLVFNDDGNLKSYKIELETNLTLYVNKSTPESYYAADPDLDYQGSAFIVSNNSIVNWTTYAHMEIPAGYEETNITVEYPLDVNLTGVFFSQDPSSLSDAFIKEYENKKVVNIPVSSITSNTNGFWKLEAVSPNYCKETDIYNNATTGYWELNNEFLSGEYINVTAKINNSQLISGYINQTKAQLQIRFPNGTIWTAENQLKQVNNTGMVYFDPIIIPTNVPNYEAGLYQAIITWNNSYSSFEMNETGMIYKEFIVVHHSKLEPDQGIYFIDDVFDDSIINIKVSFNDLVDNTAIEAAVVYTNFPAQPGNLSEISPGFYLYEFDASNANAGNNIVTIYANHTYYDNKSISITIDVIKETTLSVENEYFSVPWKQNFIVRFNYTEKNTPANGINTTSISTGWLGASLNQPSEGQYELTCSTLAYNTLTLQSFIITLNPDNFEAQSILIRVQIAELASSLELLLNNEDKTSDPNYNLTKGQNLNITVKHKDIQTEQHINNGILELIGEELILNFTRNNTLGQHYLHLNTTNLGIGAKLFTIVTQASNYQTKTISLRITVNRIEASIDTETGESQKEVEVGEEILLQIILNDTIFGSEIKNATVSYRWAYGQGELTDSDNNGIFEVILPKTEAGVYPITIIAFAGDDYNFESFELTLVVSQPVAKTGADLTWLIYVLIGGIIGLVSVFTLYQTHFKYPPMVRKIRKLKKKIGKGKKTKFILTTKRSTIIENNIRAKNQIIELESKTPDKKISGLNEAKEIKKTKETKKINKSKETKEINKTKETKEINKTKETKEINKTKETKEINKSKEKDSK